MRKILSVLAAVIMLAGCSLSESSDIEVESIESAESDIPAESTDRSENGGAPAGVREISAYAETAPSGGVSLTRGEYDYLKEMVSFEGEFVPFEELGYDLYMTYPGKAVSIFAADKELLYLHSRAPDGGLSDEQQEGFSVCEYNLLTDTSEYIAMPENCSSVVYIDREYILYSSSDMDSMNNETRYYQINRASGEIIDVTDQNLFQVIWGQNSGYTRCGDYIFFNRIESLTTDDGRYGESVSLLVRYSLTRNISEVIKAAYLLGAAHDEVIIAPFGSGLEQMHYTISSVSFDFSPDQLYLGGDQIGYVVPTDRSTIFGEKYEVGRLLPSPSGNVYKPVLTANYGTTVEEFLLTENSAAAVRVIGDTGDPAEILIVDTKNKRAAAVPEYGNETDYGYIMSDGDWIYFSYYDDSRIIAINTAG